MPKKAASAIGQITVLAEKLAEQMGYELIEAAYEKENTGMYLRFYLDKEGGVTLDDCEAYHRALQPRLEPFDYDFMEVCSPGVDRPIKNQRDADRCLGSEIEVRLYKPVDGQKAYTGLFTAYNDGDITIRCGETERTFLKKEIAVARCTVDMDEVENADLS